ncbi:antitoxin Xre/MbcA/ParS toxin-binding domain-containing protein [Pseudomonas putida]|uniref:antitoxin Xre/MbcA/ParS toxin-binding domain-containing protein n=1 Tax=Pseudomonas putida TaxID=303 RepID=UPI003AF1C5B9
MLVISLLAPCPSAEPRCWSSQFRCFVARKDQVRSQAAFVLGNDRLASDWLIQPALGLGGRTPCSLLADNEGYRHVCEYLLRIDYGVY